MATTNKEEETTNSEGLWPATRSVRSESFLELDDYLRSVIRTIPDFPKPGFQFRDITTLLLDPVGLNRTICAFQRRYEKSGIDLIVSCETRGFLFGSPLAFALQIGFVPVRKARRLPGDTIGIDYKSGFNQSNRLEVHRDAIPKGSRVVIIDDTISTGKTLRATYDLMEKAGANVVECGTVLSVKELFDEVLQRYTFRSVTMLRLYRKP